MAMVLSQSGRHSPTPGWVFWLLQIACLALMIVFITEMFAVMRARDELAAIVPGGYGSRMFLRPFILAGVLALLWWRFWWPEREGARPMALAAAFVLSINGVAIAINNSLGQTGYPPREVALYFASALVFVIYTVRGRERSE